jgi:hypothetical protein
MTKQEWYRRHACDHAHCPFLCEHPQPFMTDDNQLICGRCWFIEERVTVMQPCVPGVCD